MNAEQIRAAMPRASADTLRLNAHLLGQHADSKAIPSPALPKLAPPVTPTPQTPVKAKGKAKPRHEESRMQQELMKWWATFGEMMGLPEHLLMAFPLQGARTARNGARMKAEGMRRGLPDLLLAVARGTHHGLWIEMKTAKGYVNPHQKAMLASLAKQGYLTQVCRSTDEAEAAICHYFKLGTP